MARIRGHRNLNEDKPLYVLRSELAVDGKVLKLGEPFLWQEMEGVTPRLVRLLHEQRKIGHDRPEVPATGAEDPQRSPSEQAKAEERDKGRSGKRGVPPSARGLG